MKQHLITLCLLVAVTVYAGEYLACIDNLDDDKTNFTVIKQVENHFIILADDGDVDKLKKRNYTFQILDNNPREKEYHLVYLLGKYDLISKNVFAKYGAVIDVYEDCVLMCASEDQMYQITEYKTKVIPIDFTPIIYSSGRTSQITSHNLQSDPLIEEMVAAVSEDSLEYHLSQLTGILPITTDEGDTTSLYSRFAGNTETNRDRLVPWLKKKFLEYGCDSVYEIPLLNNDYDAPVPVGIRIGKENPSLTKFCIMGAHCDNTLDQGDCMGRIYGADDNGSGISAVLEACRVMQNYTFKNTVLFAGLNCEEKGLRGSRALAKYFSDNDFEVIGGIITYDMISHAKSGDNTVRFHYSTDVQGNDDFADLLVSASETYNTIGEVRLNGTTSVPSDVTCFWEKDIPGVCGIESSFFSGLHSLADSIGEGTNSFEYHAKVTRTGVATLATVAEPIEATQVKKDSFSGTENQKITISYNSNRQIIFYLKSNHKNGPISLRLYNVSGRIIKTLLPKENLTGDYFATWNVRDDQGYPVGRGLYMLEYRTNIKSTFKKIVVIQ